MRTLKMLLTLALAVSAGAAARAADDPKADPDKGGVAVLVEKIQDLQLSDAQEAKVAEIRKEFRPKVQEASREAAGLVKDQIEKMRDVLTAEQKQKLQDLKEERQEHREECLAHAIAHLRELDLSDAEMTKIGDIRKEYRPKIQEAMKKLEGLLTDEQKKARAEALKADKKRAEVLEALKLTDEQKEKVAGVAREVCGLVKDEAEKIREVLAAELKEKLPDLKDEARERVRDRMAHRMANLRDLNLTDEQKTKLMEIRKEYRPKVQEAGNKVRTLITEELEKIVAAIRG